MCFQRNWDLRAGLCCLLSSAEDDLPRIPAEKPEPSCQIPQLLRGSRFWRTLPQVSGFGVPQVRPAQSPVTPKATSHGEFTRMLQSVEFICALPRPRRGSRLRGLLKNWRKRFSHVALDQIPTQNWGSVSGPPASPGSFTKMSTPHPVLRESCPLERCRTGPRSRKSAQPPIRAGEFTKIFSRDQAREHAAQFVVGLLVAPKKQPPQAGPGAFTRCFPIRSQTSSAREPADSRSSRWLLR